MKYRFLMVFALGLLTISCKKGDDKQTTTAAEPAKKFNVQMEVLQPVKDIYAVYYTEDNSATFSTEHVIWNEAKPSAEFQTLNFDFPEAVVPTHVRFDIASKPVEMDVVLKKFKISYGAKSLEVRGADFFKYFYGDNPIPNTIDQAAGTITFVKKEGSKFVPYFNPTEALVAELAKLQQ